MTSLLKLEITIYFWLSLPVHSGSLKRIDYPKQICLAHPLLLNVFTALKGNHLYMFTCSLHSRLIRVAMVIAKVSGTSSIPSISSTNHKYTVLSQNIKRTEWTKGRGIRGSLFHYIEQAASSSIKVWCDQTLSMEAQFGTLIIMA